MPRCGPVFKKMRHGFAKKKSVPLALSSPLPSDSRSSAKIELPEDEKRLVDNYKSQKSEERRSRFRTGGGPTSPPKVEDPWLPIENIPDDDDDFNDYNSDHDETEVLEGMRSASPKPDTPGSATGSAQPRIKRVSSNADKFHKKKMEYLEEEHKLRLTVINEEHRAKMEAIEKEKKYWTLMEANAQKQMSFQRENSHSSIEQKTLGY
ncbi:uncharacterized protein LOC120352542 [Nilaparvata lugens]|uniref:uncharacterized protein LOC120352542 n=1 Tax=Nilaparvata lugens TaxID=108931 RepID=UPI00193DB48E|nr:uncharacterized protein LOC120352542 [Nilaparvata lugens]